MNRGALVIPQEPQKHAMAVQPMDHSNQQMFDYSEPPRTSQLEAPTMLLTGHMSEIFAAKFHPDGKILASAGTERQIYLWNVFGECENYFLFKGAHTGAILDLHFDTDGSTMFTASTDKTVGMFDMETGERVKRMKGHNGIVNACSVSRRGHQLVASASDDCTVKVWDTRRRFHIKSYQMKYQQTAVCFDDQTNQVITAGIDNDIKIFDLKQGDHSEPMLTMSGHKDTVTSLTLSHSGHHVLSNSMDHTCRTWDVRPFGPPEKCVSVYVGHKHDSFEKNLLKSAWSPDDKKIASGSASCRNVFVWDVQRHQLLYKLPGHGGSVNCVHFHPDQPIVLSVSSDKQIFLGEINE